ncbi:MAG: hypothetical protein KJ069_14885 [Anaerolineae bacterium]|nr:hypothetical protein [Anaerolineae bacterium]
MPLMGMGGLLVLRMSNCRRWQTLNDLIQALELLQQKLNLNVIDGEMGFEQPVPLDRFAATVHRKYYQNDQWDTENYVDAYPQGKLYLDLWIPTIDPIFARKSAIQGETVSVNALKYGSQYNSIRFGSVCVRDVSSNIVTSYREKIVQIYVQIAQTLIPMLSPDHVWIAEDDDYAVNLRPKDILARHLKVIYWANYLSPDFVSEATKSLYLKSPVGICRPLADGIWYQLHEQFDTLSSQKIKQIEEEALRYFNRLNIERVQWVFE